MAKPKLPRVGPVNPASRPPAFPRARCTVSVKRGAARGRVNRRVGFIGSGHAPELREGTPYDRGVLCCSNKGCKKLTPKFIGEYPKDSPKQARKL